MARNAVGPTPTTRRVDVGTTTLAVTEAGDPDGTAVLLLHGFPDRASLWDAQTVALADAGCHVVAAADGALLARQVADLSRPGALAAALHWCRANLDPRHLVGFRVPDLAPLGRAQARAGDGSGGRTRSTQRVALS